MVKSPKKSSGKEYYANTKKNLFNKNILAAPQEQRSQTEVGGVNPEKSGKRIFIATIGTVPILTETLYALCFDDDGKEKETPWVPDEIHVIATIYSLPPLEKIICVESDGPLYTIYSSLSAKKSPPPVFIHIPLKKSDVPLTLSWQNRQNGLGSIEKSNLIEDITNVGDVDLMYVCIQNVFVDAVEEANSEIHLSIAGGRKTMSAHALSVIQLFGRPNDSASHTLVSPNEFEFGNTGFWHPKHSLVPYDFKTGEARKATGDLDPKNAKIELVEVPFVVTSSGLSKTQISGMAKGPITKWTNTNNAATVRAFRNNQEIELTWRINQGYVSSSGVEIGLTRIAWVRIWLLAQTQESSSSFYQADGFINVEMITAVSLEEIVEVMKKTVGGEINQKYATIFGRFLMNIVKSDNTGKADNWLNFKQLKMWLMTLKPTTYPVSNKDFLEIDDNETDLLKDFRDKERPLRDILEVCVNGANIKTEFFQKQLIKTKAEEMLRKWIKTNIFEQGHTDLQKNYPHLRPLLVENFGSRPEKYKLKRPTKVQWNLVNA
jgi:CRISPR-associated protein (TIGR02584 family)